MRNLITHIVVVFLCVFHAGLSAAGDSNSETEAIRLFWWTQQTSDYKQATRAGEEGLIRLGRNENQSRVILFNVDDSRFKAGMADDVTVTLRYYDDQEAVLDLQYDAKANADNWTSAGRFRTEGTGGWKEHTWQVSEPLFQNRFWNHDLRLIVYGNVDLVISDISAQGRSLADVILPDIFSDGMVLQRDQPIRVWGWARSDVQVFARLDGEVVKASHEGEKWSLDFPSRSASSQPIGMDIWTSEREVRRIDDIVVGEVWLASGQSNMHMALGRTLGTEESKARPADPLLRSFSVPVQILERSRPPVGTAWQSATPETITDWTAVGYEFAYRLRRELGIPVAIVHCSVGATPTEAWSSPEVLAAGYPQWERLLSRPGPNHRPAFYASESYERLLTTVMPYAIRGFIWYQGEGNAGRTEEQLRLFPAMVDDWRTQWNDPAAPFYFVQLARHGGANWHAFRDVQRQLAESIPHAAMVVIVDIPMDYDPKDHPIHPTIKQPIGERLANTAFKEVYQLNGALSPMIQSACWDGQRLRLQFKNNFGLVSSDSKPLRGFTVADSNGVFVPVKARIETDGIVLSGFDFAAPAIVRYGAEADTPGGIIDVNLINADGLPASPFTLKVIPNRD